MKRRKIKPSSIIKQIVCILLTLIVLVPCYMVVINSFKTRSESARMNLRFPDVWQFSNYLDVIQKANLLKGLLNSLLYAGVATFLGVMLCAMASFVLSRNRTKINNFIYYFIICGLFFPVNYVTLVRVFQWFHLTNTRLGIVVVYTAMMIPFCVFTIYSFVETVPKSMDEAAILDGASPLQMFFMVAAPMMKPTLVTCFILEFMGVWNDFMTPLYLSTKSNLFPVTMSVYQFFGRNTSYWNMIFADIVMTVIPVLIIYAVGQKYLVSGTNAGAVKG